MAWPAMRLVLARGASLAADASPGAASAAPKARVAVIGKMKSGPLPAGLKGGLINYFCRFHLEMKGQLAVAK